MDNWCRLLGTSSLKEGRACCRQQSTAEYDVSNTADDDVNKMADARAQQTPCDVLHHATTVDPATLYKTSWSAS
jgi:hypothetical protein